MSCPDYTRGCRKSIITNLTRIHGDDSTCSDEDFTSSIKKSLSNLTTPKDLFLVLFDWSHAGTEIGWYDPDEGTLTSLTDDLPAKSCQGAYLSPDKTKIMYHYNDSGTYRIFVMNSDGTNKTHVHTIPSTAHARSPVGWLNSHTILYVHEDYPARAKLYAVNLDGTNNRVLIDPSVFSGGTNVADVAVSPDGQSIAFSSQEGAWSPTYDIFLADADGSNVRKFYGDASNNHTDRVPFWSADSNRIYWIHYDQAGTGQTSYSVYYKDLDSSNPVTEPDGIVRSGIPNNEYNLRQVTSPDGSKVILESNKAAYDEIFSLNLSTGDIESLFTRSNASGLTIIRWWGQVPFPSITPTPARTQERFLQQCGFGTLTCAAYSPNPDRDIIVTGGAAGAVIWNAETAQPIRILNAPGHRVVSVVVSPDGTRILTGTGDAEASSARLWDANTGEEIHLFSGHADWVYSVAFSPDGSKVLTGSSTGNPDYYGIARLWDADTGAEIQTFTGHPQAIYSVAFSPDGTRVLTGSLDNTAKLWDAETGEEIRTFFGHTGWVYSVAFSRDGNRILTGSMDATARLWDAETGEIIRTFAYDRAVISAVFSPDGARILTGSWQTACLWDIATGNPIHTFEGHTDDVPAVAFSANGSKILTGSYDRSARLWNTETGELIRTYVGHTSRVRSVASSSDGERILTAYGYPDNIAKIWDAATGTRTHTFSGLTGQINSVAFSPDGTKILTGSVDATARLWDIGSGIPIRTFGGHTSGVTSVAYSPGGIQILTGSGDATAKLWNVGTGAEIRTFSGHRGQINSVSFSLDGTRILTGSVDATAILWDARTGAEILTFSHPSGVTSVAISPNSTSVLLGGGNTATLWNAATGAKMLTFEGHEAGILSVAFSPDGTKVLTGSSDGTAKILNAATGNLIRTFLGHTHDVLSVAFSPDGSKIITGGSDGQTLIWELHPPRAIIIAGGGDYQGNAIARQTDDLGAYAYQTLRRRSYEAEDILYLTAFGPRDPLNPSKPFRDADGDGWNDVDDWATLENLEAALTGDFAKGAGRLLILMLNHGYRTDDFMAFRINETQLLSTLVMKRWLDDLQSNHQVDITLVVDSCYSGQFLEDCQGAVGGRQRILIASTGKNNEAVFFPPPDLTSFMHTFLSSAYMGNSIGEAWRAGKRFFEEFPVANQSPQIADGSAGTSVADRGFFGASWAYGVQSTLDVNQFFPVFETWSPDTTVSQGDPVNLWVRMLPGEVPREVAAIIRPPAPGVISGDPITNLPHLLLSQNPEDPSLWETVAIDVFEELGPYVVSYRARFDNQRVSNPVFTHVMTSEGAGSGYDADPGDSGGGRYRQSGSANRVPQPGSLCFPRISRPLSG